jgi:hypothetical protein
MNDKQTDLILRKIGSLVSEKAIDMCPVDMGELRRSIGFRIEGNKVVIFASAEYAKDMEYGKPAEPLSTGEKEELKGWAKRHGASPKGMVNYIQKHGIKAGTPEQPLHITSFGRDSYRPFLRPALLQSLDEIKSIVKGGMK